MSAPVMSGSETISMSGTPARLKSTPLLRSKWEFLPTSSSRCARVMRTRAQAAVEFKLDVAVGRGRLVVLGDLVILRHVRVKITFPVELGEAGNFAIQQKAGEHRQAQRLVVGHGQHAGQAEADGANVGIRRRAERVSAAAPHLRFRFKLDVRFQPDDRFVFHCGTSLTTDWLRRDSKCWSQNAHCNFIAGRNAR